MESLHEKLGIPVDEKQIISICGGGGKSSLMMALAEETREKTQTAIFTTTHFLRPSGRNVAQFPGCDPDECKILWNKGKILYAGIPSGEKNKLGPPTQEAMEFIFREAESIYIEADGAKMLPLKYPAEWEPVIPADTTETVVVAGLSALGKMTDSSVHRIQLARDKITIPEMIVTPELMARILWEGYGKYDPVFFLNQADTEELMELGEYVSRLLSYLGARKAVSGSLRNQTA